jgi:hypothetical protein
MGRFLSSNFIGVSSRWFVERAICIPFSLMCGVTYFLSAVVQNWQDLCVRPPSLLKQRRRLTCSTQPPPTIAR